MTRPACLDSGGAFCAAGDSIDAIWSAIAQGQRHLSDLPCPAIPGAAWSQAFSVAAPPLAEAGIDRRALRTMDKQAAMAAWGAHLALRHSAVFDAADRARVGLYLGLPVVDECVPPWPVLQAMHEQGLQAVTTAVFLRDTPPFSALADLNSSAASHIAARFGMTGAMGICSPHADSGLQALIEAALSVAEQENEAALAGAVSPKINPPLLLQHDHRGWLAQPKHRPGEGAAFVLLTPRPHSVPAIRVSGHARGFARSAGAVDERLWALAGQALATAGIGRAELGWTLGHPGAGAACDLDASAWCGDMGPASPMLAVLLAAHGLRQGRRLVARAGGAAHEEAMSARHALVQATGPEGQCVVVVLTRDAP